MTGFLRRVLSPYRGLLILVILLQLGQSFLTMYLPTINSRVIDYGVANADAAYIMHQGILMLGIALIQFLLSTLAGIFGAKVALMTGRDLREQVYEKLIHFTQDDRKHGSSYADYQGNKRCTAGNPVYYVLIYRDYRSTDDVYRRSCACLVPKREAFGGIACDDTSAAWGFCGIFKADPSLL